MNTIVLYAGRNKNGVFHQSEDSKICFARETGLIVCNGIVIGKVKSTSSKVTIQEVNKSIKNNVEFSLTFHSNKCWINGSLVDL